MNWSPESTKKNIHFWCGKPSESAGAKPLPGGIQLPKANSTCMPNWPPLGQGLSSAGLEQGTNKPTDGHGVTESGWDIL